MRITIKKIADLAKVSRGTVDKVINNRLDVSDEVRNRVREIADELGYKPNIIGKALAKQKKPIVIGVVMPSDDNPFNIDVKKGINAAYEELKDFGVRVEYGILKDLSVEEQFNSINTLYDKGISALALYAIDHDAIRAAVSNLINKGIPVVTFVSDILGTGRLSFVGHDLVKSGRVAGNLMGKLMNEIGKVAIITGSHSVLAHNQRIEGFFSIIEEQYKSIEIVKIVENLDQDSISYELTMSLVKSIEGLRGIYLTAGGVAGAGKAIKALGAAGKIKVISFDFVTETVNMVKEGIIDITIGQDPYFEGYKPIKILFDYLISGQIPECEKYLTRVDIRVKENIDI